MPHIFSANIHNHHVVRQFQIVVLINAPTVHMPNATSKLHFTRAYVRHIRALCSYLYTGRSFSSWKYSNRTVTWRVSLLVLSLCHSSSGHHRTNARVRARYTVHIYGDTHPNTTTRLSTDSLKAPSQTLRVGKDKHRKIMQIMQSHEIINKKNPPTRIPNRY
jgi:hypothetical protein